VKANPATKVVQRAQTQYPKNFKAVSAYFGSIPYGQQQISAAAADKNLVQMTSEQMSNLAATNPIQALTAQRRLQTLQDKAQAEPPLPGQGQFEGQP